MMAAVPAVAQPTPASLRHSPAAAQLFERDWVLMNWALKFYDRDRDILLEQGEAQAAAAEFRKIADANGDGRSPSPNIAPRANSSSPATDAQAPRRFDQEIPPDGHSRRRAGGLRKRVRQQGTSGNDDPQQHPRGDRKHAGRAAPRLAPADVSSTSSSRRPTPWAR